MKDTSVPPVFEVKHAEVFRRRVRELEQGPKPVSDFAVGVMFLGYFVIVLTIFYLMWAKFAD